MDLLGWGMGTNLVGWGVVCRDGCDGWFVSAVFFFLSAIFIFLVFFISCYFSTVESYPRWEYSWIAATFG